MSPSTEVSTDFVVEKTVTTSQPHLIVKPGLSPGNYLLKVTPVDIEEKNMLSAYLRIEIDEQQIVFRMVDTKEFDLDFTEKPSQKLWLKLLRLMKTLFNAVVSFLHGFVKK